MYKRWQAGCSSAAWACVGRPAHTGSRSVHTHTCRYSTHSQYHFTLHFAYRARVLAAGPSPVSRHVVFAQRVCVCVCSFATNRATAHFMIMSQMPAWLRWRVQHCSGRLLATIYPALLSHRRAPKRYLSVSQCFLSASIFQAYRIFS
jgi:hypothetical protein